MKKLLALMLALTLMLMSAGAIAEATVYPVTLTDQAGREVTIEAKPETLVSGYYIPTSLLIALDLDEKLVGVENKADKRAIYGLAAPAIRELPGVGTMKELDLELIASLNPDLVILPLRQKEAAATLEELGMDVLLVNPESRELLDEMTVLIAEATDTQARAAGLLAFGEAQQAKLEAALADAEKPRVYLAGNSSMLNTAGNSMYQGDMIRIAGGENVAAELTDTYWVEISYEQLLAWNPEVIVVASDADYTVEDVLNDPNLASCDAVANGRVYQVPSKAEAWDSPVPGSILGAVWLSSVLHPETCGDAGELIDGFYETFYGFTYSEN